MMTLIAFSAAQAADPISTIQNDGTGQCITITNPLTVAPCDGLPHQNYSFGLPGAIYGANNYVATPGAHCLNGSFDDNGSVNMGTCAQLNGYWWRAGKKIIMSGGTHCLAAVGSGLEMQLCDTAAVNQMWTLNSAVAADWPINGRTQMSSKATSLCLQALGAQTGWPHPGQPPLGVAYCERYMNEFLTFTLTGTIVLEGACLTDSGGSGAAGDPVALQVCDGTLSQQWLRSGDSILSKNSQLCIGISGDSTAVGAPVQLQTCSSDPYQQWDFGKLAASWPPASTVPSTAVEGATLTARQLETVVDWVQAETSISTTPFCYKTSSYDRGIGIAPSCGSGQQMDAGLCYTPCRSGYSGVGPVCWTTKPLTYNPGTHCIADILGTCVAWAMNSCRDGYTGDQIATCYINKASYGRGAGTLPNSCNSNRQMQAGLCYNNPRAGYTCNVTVCSPVCAAGTVDCGQACATDANTCFSNIADMVITPLEVLAFITTDGAAGTATIAINVAKAAVETAKLANELATAQLSLKGAVADFMNVAEQNLAAMSTDDVEAAIAKGYGRGSANYRYIAREWSSRLLLSLIAQLLVDMDTIMITAMDPTGVAATIDAFAKPPCAQHTRMPQY
jgi:hypothetical protein